MFWKQLKLTLVTAVIVALAGLVVYQHYFGPTRGVTRRTFDPQAVVQEIQSLQELATVKYTIQKVIGLEEDKVPFGSESLMMVVQATVKGGVDLAELKPQDVTKRADGTVRIRLPAAKILDIYVNDKETKVFERSKTWWTPWASYNKELEQQARRAAAEHVQAAALKMGILSNAQQNAETTICGILRAFDVQTVSFGAD